jgi:hypothetical protein
MLHCLLQFAVSPPPLCIPGNLSLRCNQRLPLSLPSPAPLALSLLRRRRRRAPSPRAPTASTRSGTPSHTVVDTVAAADLVAGSYSPATTSKMETQGGAAARGEARWPDSTRPRCAGKNAAREEAAPAGNSDVQPGRAARVRARASGRQRAVDQCGVHRDLLFLPLGRREHAAQAGPLLARAVLNGEGRRGRGWRRWGGVVEHVDLGADGAEEAVNEGGSTQVGDIGAGREEARGLGEGSGSAPRWGRRRSSRRASTMAMLLVGGGGPEAASIREGASDGVRAAEHRRPVHAAEIHPPGAGRPPRRAWRSKGKGRRRSLPQSSLLRALRNGKSPSSAMASSPPSSSRSPRRHCGRSGGAASSSPFPPRPCSSLPLSSRPPPRAPHVQTRAGGGAASCSRYAARLLTGGPLSPSPRGRGNQLSALMREKMKIAAGKPGEFFPLSFLHKPLFADAERQSAGVSLRHSTRKKNSLGIGCVYVCVPVDIQG